MTIYDAAMRYKSENVPLVVFAGKEYGTGSSRDWAAKGTILLGVRAVVAQSFERIHRSNLVGMGVVPLVFEEGTSWQTLGLKGDEQVTIRGLHGDLKPHQRLVAEIVAADGGLKRVPLICRIDTVDELDYYQERRHLAVRSAPACGVKHCANGSPPHREVEWQVTCLLDITSGVIRSSPRGPRGWRSECCVAGSRRRHSSPACSLRAARLHAPESRGRCSNCSPARAAHRVRPPTSCSASSPAILRLSRSAYRSTIGIISAGRTRSPAPGIRRGSAPMRACAATAQVYTPQIVVNGATHVLGSDRAAVEHAIAQTDRNTAVMSLPVSLSVSDSELNVNVQPRRRQDTSAVKSGSVRWPERCRWQIGRGENHGRTVTYHNVVRHWLKLGDFTGTSRKLEHSDLRDRNRRHRWRRADRAGRNARKAGHRPRRAFAPIATTGDGRQMTGISGGLDRCPR